MPRSDLCVGRNSVFEIAEDGVDLGDELSETGADLLVVRRHEVDHALEPHGELPIGLRRTDGEPGSDRVHTMSGVQPVKAATGRRLVARRPQISQGDR